MSLFARFIKSAAVRALTATSCSNASAVPAAMARLSRNPSVTSGHGFNLCGKHDRRTFKGKLYAGTNGLSRPKPPKGHKQLVRIFPVPRPNWTSPSSLPPYNLHPGTLPPAQQECRGMQQT